MLNEAVQPPALSLEAAGAELGKPPSHAMQSMATAIGVPGTKSTPKSKMVQGPEVLFVLRSGPIANNRCRWERQFPVLQQSKNQREPESVNL